MKLNKRITSLFLCSVLLFGTCGCQQSLKDEQEQVKIEEQQLDIEKLEYEYNAMITLAEDLFKMFEDAEGKIDGGKAIEIIQFVQNNRIKPTQELTIALDEAFNEFLELTIKHALASESERAKLEARIVEVLTVMETLCTEIEVILDANSETI